MKKVFWLLSLLIFACLSGSSALAATFREQGIVKPIPDGYDSSSRYDKGGSLVAGNNTPVVFVYWTGYKCTLVVNGSSLSGDITFAVVNVPKEIKERTTAIYFYNCEGMCNIEAINDAYSQLVFLSIAESDYNTVESLNDVFESCHIPAVDFSGVVNLTNFVISGNKLSSSFERFLNSSWDPSLCIISKSVGDAAFNIAQPADNNWFRKVTGTKCGGGNFYAYQITSTGTSSVYVHNESVNSVVASVNNSNFVDGAGYFKVTGKKNSPFISVDSPFSIVFPMLQALPRTLQFYGSESDPWAPLSSDVTISCGTDYYYGQSKNLGVPTKPYYDFVEWRLADNNQDYGKFGGVIDSHTFVHNFKFGTVWKQHEYNFIYDLGYVNENGNRYKTGTYTLDDCVTVDHKVDLLKVDRTGYNFKGWMLNGSIVKQAALKDDLVPVAQWELLHYNISYVYNLREVSGGTKTLYGSVFINGSFQNKYTVEDSVSLPELKCAGYKFLGWYDGSNKVTAIKKGSTGDRTLTAKWKPVTYSLTYYDGTRELRKENFTVEDVKIANGVLKKKGYEFLGWSRSKNDSKNAASLITISHETNNAVVYAQWKKVGTSTQTSTEKSTEKSSTKSTAKTTESSKTTQSTKAASKKTGSIQVAFNKKPKGSYKVAVCTNKKFKKSKTKVYTTKKSIKITKLVKGKVYYVRIRTCKKVNGKNVYGKWSSKYKVKAK